MKRATITYLNLFKLNSPMILVNAIKYSYWNNSTFLAG